MKYYVFIESGALVVRYAVEADNDWLAELLAHREFNNEYPERDVTHFRVEKRG